MVTRADGTKISDFLAKDTLSDTDLITVVSGTTNYKMTVANLKTALGLNGSASAGLIYMQGNTTDTVIAASGTAVLVAGTWSAQVANNFTTTAAGRLTYTGSGETLNVEAMVSMHPAAAGTKDLSLYIAKNGAVIAGTKLTATVTNNAAQEVSTIWRLALATDDYIEIFVANEDDAGDIEVNSAVLRVS